MAQDICSSPGHGDLPAPAFDMTPTAAKEGEQVILQCQISWKSPVTRIIFCKDGVQVHSLKAQQGKGNYVTFFPMTRESAGTFTCGYQHKDNSNRVRNSALSAPTNLRVTGSGSSSQAGTSTAASVPPATNPQKLHTIIGIIIGVVTLSLLLLLLLIAACAMRKGACRERCQR
ncbi:leukocyte immunoglobulin-like receptor subfamily B member 2 [Corvus hawaiiensis]|uniref:leukocyte immunoglobulin-like receptor subfamily B member 2 n=1 Tax=Corvus hawaiiensis TaxID=134902 RepID=UPI002019C9DA|nr:leukocyte immunoglobulin-like receptor subfamily B member 2 [Corvus hawaiiensis]